MEPGCLMNLLNLRWMALVLGLGAAVGFAQAVRTTEKKDDAATKTRREVGKPATNAPKDQPAPGRSGIKTPAEIAKPGFRPRVFHPPAPPSQPAPTAARRSRPPIDKPDPQRVQRRKELIASDFAIKDQFTRPPTDFEGPTAGDSLRIATFNTHLISPIFNKDIFDSEHADADAQMVANAIVYDAQHIQSFDIIALNEVWDEDAKNIIAKTLAPVFPYYVKRLDVGFGTFADANVGSGTTVKVPKIEDSGLMLFSKYPFVKFNVGDPVKSVTFAFHCFEACSGVDAGAAKGVGMVVAINPNTNRHYLVAFTHLQDEDPGVVELQMDEIKSLLLRVRHLNPEVVRGDTFLMGDLNIVGCSPSDQKPLQWAAGAGQELWGKLFWNDKTSYYVNPLYDGWAWTTSAFDPGYTNPGGNSRLDYIIHEHEAGHEPLAMQHIHHVLVGATNSDHVAVAADLNRPEKFCLPRLARRAGLEDPGNVNWWDCLTDVKKVPLFGELKYPGSMQWYRFDRKGTYSIGLPVELIQAGLEVTVYQAEDLSTPIAVYNKEYTPVLLGQDPPKLYQLGKYHIGEPPFFVCVSNPQRRTWSGHYQLAVHRHAGATKEDAITLAPGEDPYDPQMPTDKPLNADDTVWFELITDQAHSGQPQKLEFAVKNDSGQPLTMKLLQEDPVDSNNMITLASTGAVSEPVLTRDEVGGKKFYLTVGRQQYTQTNFQVGWRTNLTWLVGMGLPGTTWPFKLVCGDETGSDWAGSDEIDLYIYVDGALYSLEHFGDVDTGDHYSMEGMLKPVAFLNSVQVKISENDDNSKEWSENSISPLDPGKPNDMRKWVDLLPDDGNYEFRFNLSHSLNK